MRFANLIFNNNGVPYAKRIEPGDVLVFCCFLKSALYFVCGDVVAVHGAGDVFNELVEVVIGPIILSNVFFDVVVEIRREACGGGVASHEMCDDEWRKEMIVCCALIV